MLNGIGINTSVTLTTDNIRHMLAWTGRTDLDQLQDRATWLRFHLKQI